MDNSTIKRLYDILSSITEIEDYFQNIPRQFENYRTNTMLRRAIHMNLAIIGEATNQILKEHPDIEISHARSIVNTRNYIIHGYDSLRSEIIWAIVINDLPILKQEVARLLDR